MHGVLYLEVSHRQPITCVSRAIQIFLLPPRTSVCKTTLYIDSLMPAPVLKAGHGHPGVPCVCLFACAYGWVGYLFLSVFLKLDARVFSIYIKVCARTW